MRSIRRFMPTTSSPADTTSTRRCTSSSNGARTLSRRRRKCDDFAVFTVRRVPYGAVEREGAKSRVDCRDRFERRIAGFQLERSEREVVEIVIGRDEIEFVSGSETKSAGAGRECKGVGDTVCSVECDDSVFVGLSEVEALTVRGQVRSRHLRTRRLTLRNKTFARHEAIKIAIVFFSAVGNDNMQRVA